ncbi:hypothetical protein CV667_05865 [Borreliella burgdorferi]|nr:hypothetical protein CV681_05495 [Borreliella burgdorferi]PRR00767.1 hypothetical protein CV678_05845 [Borreliella burgdorferi]PRR03576.1 hypothetical protein CV667_05865 [Borreliella burgdorferi]PRR10918.1 hypothetical protein CV660_05390 [Borreliella burgdorferi]PRR17084.1 hypothetical protein CV651_05295 [Borreliella burgdorferi]
MALVKENSLKNKLCINLFITLIISSKIYLGLLYSLFVSISLINFNISLISEKLESINFLIL